MILRQAGRKVCTSDKKGVRARIFWGAYNGHSVPVVEDEETKLIDKPGYNCRATTRKDACAIARTGLRAMGRNDMHLVPLQIDSIQEEYLRPPTTRKSHIIVIAGRMAKTAGVSFFLL